MRAVPASLVLPVLLIFAARVSAQQGQEYLPPPPPFWNASQWVPFERIREGARQIDSSKVARIQLMGHDFEVWPNRNIITTRDPEVIHSFVVALRNALMPAPAGGEVSIAIRNSISLFMVDQKPGEKPRYVVHFNPSNHILPLGPPMQKPLGMLAASEATRQREIVRSIGTQVKKVYLCGTYTERDLLVTRPAGVAKLVRALMQMDGRACDWRVAETVFVELTLKNGKKVGLHLAIAPASEYDAPEWHQTLWNCMRILNMHKD